MYIHVPIRLQEPDGFLGPHCRGMIKRALSLGIGQSPLNHPHICRELLPSLPSLPDLCPPRGDFAGTVALEKLKEPFILYIPPSTPRTAEKLSVIESLSCWICATVLGGW